MKKILGAVVLGAVALIVGSVISIEHSYLIAGEPHASTWVAQRVKHMEKIAYACEGEPVVMADRVRGLQGVGVPAMASAKRMTFGEYGKVMYAMRATPEAVASFYTQRMAAHCWRQASDGGLVFVESATGDAVRIAIASAPNSEKTYVTYERGGVVLGESTVNAAQDFNSGSFMPPPPQDGSGGMMTPPGGFMQQPGGMMPPKDNFIQQPGGQMPGQNGFMPMQDGMQQPGGQLPGQNSFMPPPNRDGQFGGQGEGMMPQQKGMQQGSQFMGQQGQFGGQDQGGFEQGKNQFGQNQGFDPRNPGGPGQGMMQGEGMGDGQEGQMEEQQKMMDEQRFKMMKQGVVQFAKQTAMMKKRMTQVETKLKACGLSLPEDLKNALDASDGLAAKIAAAQDADQLEEVVIDVEDVATRLQEGGQEIPELFKACELKKRIDKDFKLVETAFARTHKKALASKDEGIIGLSKEVEAAIIAAKGEKDAAKALAVNDPIEAASQMEGLYEKLGEIKGDIEGVEMALNIKKNIAKIGSDIKRYESTIARLEKQKKDVTAAKELLTQAKSQYEELKAALQGGDKEQLYELIQAFYDTKQQLDEEIQSLSGGSYVPKVNVQEKSFNFQIPQGFEKQMGGGEEGMMFPGGGMGQQGFSGQAQP